MAGAGETPRRQTCARGLASGRGLRHSRDPAHRLALLPTTWRRNLSETFRFPAGIDRRASASPRRDQLPPEPRDPAWGRRVGVGTAVSNTAILTADGTGAFSTCCVCVRAHRMPLRSCDPAPTKPRGPLLIPRARGGTHSPPGHPLRCSHSHP